MKIEGVSFRHAVELLRNDTPSLVANIVTSSPVKKTTVPKLEATEEELMAALEAEEGAD